MQTNTSSDDLLRQLSTAVVPAEDAAHARARRERIVLHLAGLVEGMPSKLARRRRFVRAATFGSAAAILVFMVGLTATRLRSHGRDSELSADSSALVLLEGSVQVIRPSVDLIAAPLERISVGNADEVVTAEGGRARALLASGAEVEIDPLSRVRLVRDRTGSNKSTTSVRDGNEAVVLGAGRVSLRVPKLGPQRSLAVQTPEAMVVVHGTAFSVERRIIPGETLPRTTVGVTEGSVAVRHDGAEVMLHAGDHWSSGSLPAHEDEPERRLGAPMMAPTPATSRPRSNAQGQRTGGRVPKGADAPEKSSSLAAENRLLQAAMAARQQGDVHRAMQLATELVTRFPASPLVEEARVEHMRALVSAAGVAAAAAEARSYLSDYPQGFARQEANRILASPSR